MESEARVVSNGGVKWWVPSVAVVFAACGNATPEPGGATEGSTASAPDDSSAAPDSNTDVASEGPDTTFGAESNSTSTTASTAPDSTDAGTAEDADTSTTGPGLTPTLTLAQITATNRAYVEMHGGWGNHLRAPMDGPNDSLWFAYDGGPSVASNTTIHYAQWTEAGWAIVASQAHAPGVQQNSAHVLRGNFILTYSVNVAQAVLEECYFDTTDFANAACNTIALGGPFSTPPSSNYVGAAVGPSNEKVVWFTVVGAGGGVGQFIYGFDAGGGWSAPVTTVLPGYNDFAYVRAHFRDDGQISWLGQAYIGAFPNGDFGVGVAELGLGQVPSFATMGPAPAADESVRSGRDVWIDPATGDSHALARVDGTTHYYVRPAGASWADHVEPVDSFEGITNARWIAAPDQPLVLVTSGAADGGVRLRWAQPDGEVDWLNASGLDVEVAAEGFAAPSAIYTMGREYQSVAPSGLHFALCGQYQVSDHEIWHGVLRFE